MKQPMRFLATIVRKKQNKNKNKKTLVTAKIVDLCNKRRELRKKRFEPEGSENYKEVNNNIKRCMKKERKKLDRTM